MSYRVEGGYREASPNLWAALCAQEQENENRSEVQFHTLFQELIREAQLFNFTSLVESFVKKINLPQAPHLTFNYIFLLIKEPTLEKFWKEAPDEIKDLVIDTLFIAYRSAESVSLWESIGWLTPEREDVWKSSIKKVLVNSCDECTPTFNKDYLLLNCFVPWEKAELSEELRFFIDWYGHIHWNSCRVKIAEVLRGVFIRAYEKLLDNGQSRDVDEEISNAVSLLSNYFCGDQEITDVSLNLFDRAHMTVMPRDFCEYLLLLSLRECSDPSKKSRLIDWMMTAAALVGRDNNFSLVIFHDKHAALFAEMIEKSSQCVSPRDIEIVDQWARLEDWIPEMYWRSLKALMSVLVPHLVDQQTSFEYKNSIVSIFYVLLNHIGGRIGGDAAVARDWTQLIQDYEEVLVSYPCSSTAPHGELVKVAQNTPECALLSSSVGSYFRWLAGDCRNLDVLVQSGIKAEPKNILMLFSAQLRRHLSIIDEKTFKMVEQFLRDEQNVLSERIHLLASLMNVEAAEEDLLETCLTALVDAKKVTYRQFRLCAALVGSLRSVSGQVKNVIEEFLKTPYAIDRYYWLGRNDDIPDPLFMDVSCPSFDFLSCVKERIAPIAPTCFLIHLNAMNALKLMYERCLAGFSSDSPPMQSIIKAMKDQKMAIVPYPIVHNDCSKTLFVFVDERLNDTDSK